MKNIGIIAEFNPFHEGHKYLIENAVRANNADGCIAVMSGNFVQRGGPAVCDKWTRAKSAVEMGVNLVIELPVVYSCNSAEYFAGGGVKTLEAMGNVDVIAFGSENGDINRLKEVVSLMKDNEPIIQSEISRLCKGGYTYPAARSQAMEAMLSEENKEILKEPNNILAVEYLKQVKTLESYTIRRAGEGHHQSASKIRKVLETENPQKFSAMAKTYFDLVRSKILSVDKAYLATVAASGEGLGNRLKDEIRYASSEPELIDRVKSKAYTYSRVSRLLTQTLLGIDTELSKMLPQYIRVLAFDSKGAEILREIKKSQCNSVPVITNVNKTENLSEEGKKLLEKDILASDLYNIICEKDLYKNSDYVVRPWINV